MNYRPVLNSGILLILALFAINWPFNAVHAQTPTASRPSAEQEILAAEAQLSAALSTVDVDQLRRLWADDFVDDGRRARHDGEETPRNSESSKAGRQFPSH
jgi:hypothetical protein